MPIETLLADAEGSDVDWGYAGAASKVAAIQTSNANLSYIYGQASAGGGGLVIGASDQSFTVPALNGSAVTVTQVALRQVTRSVPAGTFNAVHGYVLLGAAETTGPSHPVTGGFTEWSDVLARPGGGSWTPADFPSTLQMGNFFEDDGVGGSTGVRTTFMALDVTTTHLSIGSSARGGGYGFLIAGLAGAAAWLDLPGVLRFLAARHGLRFFREELPTVLTSLGAPARSWAAWERDPVVGLYLAPHP